jgi:hypothetical protein
VWAALVFFLIVGAVWFIDYTSCAATEIPIGDWAKGAGTSYRATQADLLSAGLISKEVYDRRISAASLRSDMDAARTKRYQQGEQELAPATAPSATTPTSGPADANETSRP